MAYKKDQLKDCNIGGGIVEDTCQTKDQSDTKEDEQNLLSLKAKTDDGSFAYIFSMKLSDENERWRCHLCDVVIIDRKHVDTHIQTSKHHNKLLQPTHPRSLFTRFDEEENAVDLAALAPGEPVPPGCEDVFKRVTEIQITLDKHKASPLIGLEYLVELTPDEINKEPSYICLLCQKRGDPRVAMAHLTSYNHRSKYLGIYYPTAFRIMSNDVPRSKEGRRTSTEILLRICAKIEEVYGRLRPICLERKVFEEKKEMYIKQIVQEHHFRETPEKTFAELVDINIMEKMSKNLDEFALPHSEVQDEDRNKSVFNKSKTFDRSKLRLRNSESKDEDKIKINITTKINKEKSQNEGPDSKTPKLDKSLSPISSVSTSSVSRSRSRSRSKSRSHSRSHYSRRCARSKYRREGYRSRSRSRQRRSRSYTRRSNSVSKSRRKSRSSSIGPRSRARKSRSRSPSRGHYNRSRNGQSDNRLVRERSKWERFRTEADKLECEMVKNLKAQEKSPEKHPMYPEEWKKFWNFKYKQLVKESKDPNSYDFKPEWIEYWNKKMKEFHDEELKKKKEELKKKLDLQPKNKPTADDDVIVISPSSSPDHLEVVKKPATNNDTKISKKGVVSNELKNKHSRSLSPWEENEEFCGTPPKRQPDRERGMDWYSRGSGGMRSRGRGKPFYKNYNYCKKDNQSEPQDVLSVLRLLTAMESQLGSLGPRVNNLLAQALALEKKKIYSAQSLLFDAENIVLFETVKEKLKGQIIAGIVERNMLTATRSSIANLESLLSQAEDLPKPKKPIEPLLETPPILETRPLIPVKLPRVQPVSPVDKVAIAQQIATALVAQGKTDVTHAELEQLIDAVVCMAQVSTASNKPITTDAFVTQLQQQCFPDQQAMNQLSVESSLPISGETSTLEKLFSAISSVGSKNTEISHPSQSGTSLQLLQSAYGDNYMSPKEMETFQNILKPISDLTLKSSDLTPTTTILNENMPESKEELTEKDLKNLMQNFKDLLPEEQHGFITYLRKLEVKEPQIVEKLRQYINPNTCTNFNVIPQTGSNSDVHIPTQVGVKIPAPHTSSHSGGRLSPFSSRMGGINPSQEERGKVKQAELYKPKFDDSDDDDYSFDDICAAASQNVKIIEKQKEEKKQLEEEKRRKMEEDKTKEEERKKKIEERKKKMEEEKKKKIEEERNKKLGDTKMQEEEKRLKEKKTEKLNEDRKHFKSEYIDKLKDNISSSMTKRDEAAALFKQTKATIANVMGELPGKFMKRERMTGSRGNSPIVLLDQSSLIDKTSGTGGLNISIISPAASRNQRPQKPALNLDPSPQEVTVTEPYDQSYAASVNPAYPHQYGDQSLFQGNLQQHFVENVPPVYHGDQVQGFPPNQFNTGGDYNNYYNNQQEEQQQQQGPSFTQNQELYNQQQYGNLHQYNQPPVYGQQADGSYFVPPYTQDDNAPYVGQHFPVQFTQQRAPDSFHQYPDHTPSYPSQPPGYY